MCDILCPGGKVGLIVGVVIAVLVVIGLIIACIVICCVCYKRNQNTQNNNSVPTNGDPAGQYPMTDQQTQPYAGNTQYPADQAPAINQQ